MTRAQAIGLMIALMGTWEGCSSGGEARAGGARALLEKGREEARQGNYRMAVEDYSLAITKEPELAEAYNERGKANVQLRLAPGESPDVRKYEQSALEDFSIAVEKNPAYGDAYFNRAMVLASRAQYKRAVDDLINAARYNSNDPEIHRWLGDLYDQKFEDRTTAAMEHYEKYLDLGGTDPNIREKVKAWKDSKKLAPSARGPNTKPPTAEDEVKAGELHARAMDVLLHQPDKTEALQILETLLTTYANTKYVQERMKALQAALSTFKGKGVPK